MLTAATLLTLALAATGFAQAPPEGYRTVTIATSWDSKFVVQPSAPAQAGSSIILSSAKNTPEQQWYLQDGSTKVQLAESELCLDAGTGRNNGSPLTIADCADGQASQNWEFNEAGQLVLEGSQLCADLYTGAVRDNTPIVLWQCIAGDKNHLWTATDIAA